MVREPRLKHVGADSVLAERNKMLSLYDAAKQQSADDPVKVEHGKVAEELFRQYLERLLPRKYGVAKGHIITRDLSYDGPLEEWDILIYDALETPVLYVRTDAGATPLLGIPARYVKGVVEVKATLTQANAKKVADKLLRLRPFIRPQGSTRCIRDDFLPWGFLIMGVFFETATAGRADYTKCLNMLRPLGYPSAPLTLETALVLRSQNWPDASGVISPVVTGDPVPDVLCKDERFELSEPEAILDGSAVSLMVSYGFGLNVFSHTIMDLIERLNDGPCRDMTAGSTDLTGFGHNRAGNERQPLWPEHA